MPDIVTVKRVGIKTPKRWRIERLATVPPTVDDDSTKGFGPGSIWMDVVAGEAYIGIDGAAGAAVWEQFAPGTGSIGADGSMGPPGFDGEDGADGYGLPGPAGSTGATGATGTTGAAGETGQIGPPGYDGEDGEDGYGLPGPQGAAGATGATGSAGATGAQGPAGFGIDGLDGEDGWIGPPGITGAAGATGATGAAGPAGLNGFGYDGTDGEDGWVGPPGPAYVPSVTLVEKDLGSTPRLGGSFDVAATGLVANALIHIDQVAAPLTGKGTRPDENEMDLLDVVAYAVDATTLRVYWAVARGNGPVMGNFKFAYGDRPAGAPSLPGGYAEGTSFPTSPVADQKFYRTDLDLLCYYDGTRWLTTTLYFMQVIASDVHWPIAATGTPTRVPTSRGVGTDIWLERLVSTFYISGGGSALGASHKWIGTFRKVDPAEAGITTVVTVNIDSGASSSYRIDDQAIGALLGTAASFPSFLCTWTKTGTPGALRVVGQDLSYRIVMT